MQKLDIRVLDDILAQRIALEFDADYYLNGFSQGRKPEDPLEHYISAGWYEGKNPCDWFSTTNYLFAYPDVAESGMNPFVHYLLYERKERRNPHPVLDRATELMAAQKIATSPGPLKEEFIACSTEPDVEAIAYYLPQFHACPENDAFWGRGFTEWRNVSRGFPRYAGHLQPRVPSDLGSYDLLGGDVYRQQIELARAAGLFGFCYYYYAFGSRRVLDRPIERIFNDPKLDLPFALMWANESWTRRCDGRTGELLVKQDYNLETLCFITSDLVRHFRDPRYIHVDDRPLLFIYNVREIPQPTEFFDRMRQIFMRDHGCDPLLFMAQTFDAWEPASFGLDGAIQLPPHNLSEIPTLNDKLNVFLNDSYVEKVIDYNEFIIYINARSEVNYSLIRCASPNWDNEPRMPNSGLQFHNSTPSKFSEWVRACADYARRKPIQGGGRFIAINAWNEWAEGAFLGPDVHYGYAYLNALGRGLIAGSQT